MDQMELRSVKALVKGDQKEDSDDDPENAKKLTPLEE